MNDAAAAAPLASTRRTCAVCGAEHAASVPLEEAAVRSNVRAFRHETFFMWRCPACASLHARDEVDLPSYYAQYPFHALPSDWRTRVMYDAQLDRLRRAGLKPEHTLLDYGCGGGGLVRHLRMRGYGGAVGFDEYTEGFDDRSVLDRTYDCVMSQDVLEHVTDPNALLDTFGRLTRPGGAIVIGTPNAEAIDLSNAEMFVHTLHAPYHRHIFSKTALVEAGERRGWQLERYYPTMYANTRVPFLNSAFYLYYAGLVDDTLDGLVEPPRVLPLALRFPLTLFWGFFGYFLARETDVMAVFRRN